LAGMSPSTTVGTKPVAWPIRVGDEPHRSANRRIVEHRVGVRNHALLPSPSPILDLQLIAVERNGPDAEYREVMDTDVAREDVARPSPLTAQMPARSACRHQCAARDAGSAFGYT
jgi:hypothetical protein